MWGIAARAYVHSHTPFSYLRNGLTDCAEILIVVRDPLDWNFTEVKGVQVHVHTLFSCLGNGWADCVEICCVVSGTLAFTQDGNI